MEARQIRGLQLAQTTEITRVENLWIVPSQTSSKKYAVDLDGHLPTCTCPDHKKHGLKCKHIYAAEYMLQQESGTQLPEPPPIARRTYKQAWREYNLAQTNEKAKLLELLHELCAGIEEPAQTMGRPRAPFSDTIFAACLKVYCGMSGRRNQSDMREALMRGYVSKPIHYNTLSKYLEMEDLTPYLKQLIVESSLPLKSVESDFAVDSSGFSSGIATRWFNAKYTSKPEATMIDWVKVHIMTGVKTNIVTSVEVSERRDHDYPYFEPLVKDTARNFTLREVSADKAYSGVSALRLVVDSGAMPYIPFKGHATSKHWRDKSGLWTRMFHFYKYNQDEFLRCYHKRSNVESTFSMIKGKFGERLRSKIYTAQVNEVLCKILCHNICVLIQSFYELGIEMTLWSKSSSDHKV